MAVLHLTIAAPSSAGSEGEIGIFSAADSSTTKGLLETSPTDEDCAISSCIRKACGLVNAKVSGDIEFDGVDTGVSEICLCDEHFTLLFMSPDVFDLQKCLDHMRTDKSRLDRDVVRVRKALRDAGDHGVTRTALAGCLKSRRDSAARLDNCLQAFIEQGGQIQSEVSNRATGGPPKTVYRLAGIVPGEGYIRTERGK